VTPHPLRAKIPIAVVHAQAQASNLLERQASYLAFLDCAVSDIYIPNTFAAGCLQTLT